MVAVLSYGEEEEPSKASTTEPAKQQHQQQQQQQQQKQAAPVPYPADAPPQPHEVSFPEAQPQLQELATPPVPVQKAIDPRAPPTSVNITHPIKMENRYTGEDDADEYSGWDAAVAAGTAANTAGTGGPGGVVGGGSGHENGSYGYDGMGAAGYGDPQATGSPAIKEDGCVSILHFSCCLFALWAWFFEARGRMGWSWLVSRSCRAVGLGCGRSRHMVGLEGIHERREDRLNGKFFEEKKGDVGYFLPRLSRCWCYFFHGKDFDRGPWKLRRAFLLCHLPTSATTYYLLLSEN
jgi:hypothetical protein